MSDPFSPIIIAPAFKFADNIVGIIEASTTLKLIISCTLSLLSTTEDGSDFNPHFTCAHLMITC